MSGWRVSIDVGGTFTDGVASGPSGEARCIKVLSSGAIRTILGAPIAEDRLAWAPPCPNWALAGLIGCRIRPIGGGATRRVVDAAADSVRLDASIKNEIGWRPGASVSLETGEPSPILAARLLTATPAGATLPIDDFRLATTRATNALLARQHARVALLTTEGFGDLLEIGDQRRPDLFALSIQRPRPITDLTFEAPARVDARGAEIVPLDEAAVRRSLAAARRAGATQSET
ncbi:MAG: hydantoinase/oxoprolinase N-terminal domain-containing protein, partial [Planctomycetota bacterium]